MALKQSSREGRQRKSTGCQREAGSPPLWPTSLQAHCLKATQRLTKCAPRMHTAGTCLLLLALDEAESQWGKHSCQLCHFTTLRGGEAGGTRNLE